VFDIGWPEMMVVAMVLIIVVGPKDLPRVIRTAGKWMAKARSLTSEFQNSMDDMVRQADLDEVRREVNSISKPDLGKEFESMVDPTISESDYPGEMQDRPPAEVVAPAAPAAAPPDAMDPAEVVAPAAPAAAPPDAMDPGDVAAPAAPAATPPDAIAPDAESIGPAPLAEAEGVAADSNVAPIPAPSDAAEEAPAKRAAGA
jgi:sec-independent protein translocase protein TatB